MSSQFKQLYDQPIGNYDEVPKSHAAMHNQSGSVYKTEIEFYFLSAISVRLSAISKKLELFQHAVSVLWERFDRGMLITNM